MSSVCAGNGANSSSRIVDATLAPRLRISSSSSLRESYTARYEVKKQSSSSVDRLSYRGSTKKSARAWTAALRVSKSFCSQ